MRSNKESRALSDSIQSESALVLATDHRLLESPMARPLIAVTDSVFPSLDPAMAAPERGIVVTYVPDYCMQEVSDHAMALLLALARKVVFSNGLVQAGRWEMPAVVPIRRLEGQTLGLVGFGNIPRRVAPKAQAFGLRVLVHDPYVAPDVLRAADVTGAGFEDLLASSDFVSIH